MFFGATKNREDNLETFFGTVSKHRKVIIEGSSGIMNFDMGPMERKSQNQAPYAGHRQFRDSEFSHVFV